MQSTTESLSEAIRTRTPIDFSYLKSGKVSWNRKWNPHAIYKFVAKDGAQTVKVHIWQTGWVSDTGEQIPGWRNFDLEYISSVHLLDWSFPVADWYNPDYYNEHPAIIKI